MTASRPARLCAAALLLAAAFALGAAEPAAPAVTRQTETDPLNRILYFNSAALAKAADGEATERRVEVRLPRSYAADPARRYPVLYTLHGFGDPAGQFIPLLRGAMDRDEPPLEVIVVAVDGENKLGGSFYANSPLTGNFEDLVVREAVPLVDANFRTVARREGRALAGFSMGGFGAWNLALRHPEVFAASWSRSPGAFDPDGARDAYLSWNDAFRIAYSSVFSPDAPYPAHPLAFDGSAAEAPVAAAWDGGFGGLAAKIERYRAAGAVLSEMDFHYGANDDYPWIARGTAYLAQRLREAGVAVRETKDSSRHALTRDSVNKSLVPFVKRVFGLP